MARKVDRKQHIRKGKNKVSVVHRHKTTVKDKAKLAEERLKAKQRKLREGVKTAYSNDKYDVINKNGLFFIVDKKSGKTMARSEKPSVIKQFVGDGTEGKKGADDFVARKGFERKERMRKYRTKVPSKRGKEIKHVVEKAAKDVYTGTPEMGRQKGLPARILKKIATKKNRPIPRKLKRMDTPARPKE